MVLHFCRVGRAGKGSRRPKIMASIMAEVENSHNIKRLAYNRIPQKCGKVQLRTDAKISDQSLRRNEQGEMSFSVEEPKMLSFYSCVCLLAQAFNLFWSEYMAS